MTELVGLYNPITLPWSQKFLNYWEFLQNEALKQNKVLFYETEWGKPRYTEKFEIRDLQCWVVPIELAEHFNDLWLDVSMDLFDEYSYLNHMVLLENNELSFLDMDTYLEILAFT